MKRLLAAALLAAVLASPCRGEENPSSRLYFNKSGFSIAALEDSPRRSAYTVLAMFLPVSEKFAPNVNIIIQPFEGTLEQYARLTRGQIRAGRFSILEEKFSPDSVAWEYAGKMGELDLHWYARAVRRADLVYLVTATSSEAQWPSLAVKLKRCVDSFRIEKQRPKE